MDRETADNEICCPPSCSNSSIISERDMDGEWSFKTSMSSRSPSFSFSDVKPPLGFADVLISSQYLNHTDFTVFTETRNSYKLCNTPWNITRHSVASVTDNAINDQEFKILSQCDSWSVTSAILVHFSRLHSSNLQNVYVYLRVRSIDRIPE